MESEKTTASISPARYDETKVKEERNRLSMAASFDRLVEVNLQLTTQVARLVRVSYAVLLVQVLAVLSFMFWRR